MWGASVEALKIQTFLFMSEGYSSINLSQGRDPTIEMEEYCHCNFKLICFSKKHMHEWDLKQWYINYLCQK